MRVPAAGNGGQQALDRLETKNRIAPPLPTCPRHCFRYHDQYKLSGRHITATTCRQCQFEAKREYWGPLVREMGEALR